ncbi:TROVE domain-containing protein [Catenulispora sp. NF23]|uniref:TROVE domain-containing protein n=1 Tax=Catenulispora pinistramenti TaxID=2705254 RepID=A0ABS5KR02_9ACTN|nr:TROVE domain-containing protein [Catenulispora pinistramenti]MBS2532531.1 TROVE domain-containing protein [Catenulispora pinistramenti]MBS2548464.1 TROVE domain-containing protein [Catenulispora pinistramenti]
MSKFNKSPTDTTETFQGGKAYKRDAKSDLFLFAVTNMVGEDTFYEAADIRDQRYRELVHTVAVADPEWMLRFVTWLRAGANMRSAAVVAACEAVRARLDAGASGHSRQLIAAACQRADEPGEVLAYWTGRYGRALPKPVKRGVADAVARLYNEYSFAKYDSDAKSFRFGDVIDLVHPVAAADKPWQGDLFRHALDRRHSRENPVPETLVKLTKRAELLATPVQERRGVLLAEGGAARLAEAGMTWEALAGWLQGPMDKAAWESVIPSMGLMALARNLRNFDQAEVADAVAWQVCARFLDPEQVARSRMLPYRWLSAYKAAPSLRWGHALEGALGSAIGAVPELPGRTLVLVDTSASMTRGVSARSTITHLDIGALIGVALADRAAGSGRGDDVDLIGFADGLFTHKLARGGSVLREIERFAKRYGEVGHGTRLVDAVANSYDEHDRVVIVSDMQAFPYYYNSQNKGADAFIPDTVPVFAINTAGYGPSALPPGKRNRFEIGGFSDKVFSMFALLADGDRPAWPF